MQEILKDTLKEKSLKVTPARLAVLEILSKSKVPLDAETIYKQILKIKKLKNINATTVYRTLLSLQESEILRRVDLRQDSVHFELKELDQNHHHHMVCMKCKDIEDFEDTGLEKILKSVVGKSTKFKKITEHSLELFGFCKSCA